MSDKKKELKPNTYKFDTLSLHAGYQPHKNAGSRQVPWTSIFVWLIASM